MVRTLVFATIVAVAFARTRHLRQADTKAGPAVVWLGDSITQQLTDKPMWSELFAPLNSLNLAVGGHRTEDLKNLINNGAIDKVKPKVVVILIGTNNLGDGPETIADKIVEIVDLVQRKLPGAKIVVVELLPRSELPDELRERNNRANLFLNRALKKRSGVQVVGFGEDLVDQNLRISPQDMPDFLHFTEKGYRKAFKPLYDLLQKLLVKNRSKCFK